MAIIALLTGLAVTAALAVTTLLLYDRNEDRLLGLRARQLGLVLSTASAPKQTELASAAELARATHGNQARFRALLEPEVGTGREFSSASLWPLGVAHSAPTVVVGATPQITTAQATELFARAARSHRLSVLGLLRAPQPGIAYADTATRAGRGFVAFAETPLPADRRSRLESNTAFSDLDYAVYLGHSTSSADLLVTSLKHLPITARRASSVVPLGDQSLTLVITPRGSLGGTCCSRSRRLCWPTGWFTAASGLSSLPGCSTGWRRRPSTCMPSSVRSPRPSSMLCYRTRCRRSPA